MTRDDAYTYLSTQLNTMLTEVGVDVIDPTSLDIVIDDALLMMGVTASSLTAAVVADGDVPAYRKLLRYAGIRYVYDQALNRVDVQISDPNVRKDRSQFVKSLEGALTRAKADADPFIVGESAFQSGSITYGERTVPPGYEDASWLF